MLRMGPIDRCLHKSGEQRMWTQWTRGEFGMELSAKEERVTKVVLIFL
jgi:hypothetical protein